MEEPRNGNGNGEEPQGPTNEDVNKAVLALWQTTPPGACVAHKVILKPMLVVPGGANEVVENLLVMRVPPGMVFSRPLEVRTNMVSKPEGMGLPVKAPGKAPVKAPEAAGGRRSG